MTPLLSVSGAVIAALLVGALLTLLGLRGRRRSLERRLGELGVAASVSDLPSRIELEPLDDPHWTDPGAVENAARALRSRGFEAIGSFRVPGIPGLQLSALCNPVERCYAMIGDRRAAGTWVEILVAYESGEELTVSSHPHAGHLDRPDDLRLRVEPGASASRLVDSALAHRGNGPFSPTFPEAFASRYRTSHERYMDWRKKRGGLTLEEVRRMALASGKPYDEESVRALHDLARRQHARKLDRECLQEYAQRIGTPGADLEELGEELLVVHEFSIADVVFQRCARLLGDEARSTPVPEKGVDAQAQAAFEGWNSRLPAGRRFRKVGELWSPVHAVVYRLVLQAA